MKRMPYLLLQVVPGNSSALALLNAVPVLMEASHTTICKFPSEVDELYIRVADHMLELLAWATQPLLPISSILTDQADPGLPPSYASLTSLGSKTLLGVRRRGRADSDDSTESDPIHDDGMPQEWFNRIRGVSPFHSPTPISATRSQKGSSDELSVPERAKPTWPIGMSLIPEVNITYRMLITPSHAPIPAEPILHKSISALAEHRRRDEPGDTYTLDWCGWLRQDTNRNSPCSLVS